VAAFANKDVFRYGSDQKKNLLHTHFIIKKYHGCVVISNFPMLYILLMLTN